MFDFGCKVCYHGRKFFFTIKGQSHAQADKGLYSSSPVRHDLGRGVRRAERGHAVCRAVYDGRDAVFSGGAGAAAGHPGAGPQGLVTEPAGHEGG